MNTRIAVISMIVERREVSAELNELLHAYGQYVIGRMGVPYRQRGVHIICLALEAPQDVISALSGKLGRLDGVTVKATYSNCAYLEADHALDG